MTNFYEHLHGRIVRITSGNHAGKDGICDNTYYHKEPNRGVWIGQVRLLEDQDTEHHIDVSYLELTS